MKFFCKNSVIKPQNFKHPQSQNSHLWEEMPETTQGDIRGGMFDAFTKVVTQVDSGREYSTTPHVRLREEFQAELSPLRQANKGGVIRGTLLW
ncbi:MAG: hypothetical protein ACHWZW_10070 [Spirulina sp.]